MKLSEILMGSDARMKAVMREVNAVYLENRWEFETTTVCNPRTGTVSYVHGTPPKPLEYFDGQQISKGVTWRTEGALGKRPSIPEWKIRHNIARTEANIRAAEKAYRNK